MLKKNQESVSVAKKSDNYFLVYLCMFAACFTLALASVVSAAPITIDTAAVITDIDTVKATYIILGSAAIIFVFLRKVFKF